MTSKSPPPGPKLLVIARPALDLEKIHEFLGDEELYWRRSDGAQPSEELIEFAGRLCYLSFGDRQSGKSNKQYIEHLINAGHESVLEHVWWTFIITGVSRAFTHQLVRHRVGFSFSQLSQQYHDERDATSVIPSLIRRDPKLAAKWEREIRELQKTYQEILDSLEEELRNQDGTKLKKEAIREVRTAARSVLPSATETKIVVTANARAIRHFLSVRGAIIGDEEMRLVSSLIYEVLYKEAPSLVSDFRTEILQDGLPLILKTTAT